MNADGRSMPELLLAWYENNHRHLPWRLAPGSRHAGSLPDPYRVWLSEVMLQQTTVKAVRPYFLAFVQRWPTVDTLAEADESDVLKAWAGLGYYSRARNLKRCAEAVSREHGGRFPDTEAQLIALPGIGAYTAAAIAAIAFDRPSAVVDGNVERVVARLEAIETPLPAAKPRIRKVVAVMTPSSAPGDFAQAMMDLGATICTPKRPACALCPLNRGCAALQAGDPETFPRKAPKAEKAKRRGAAFVAIAPDGAVYLTRRQDTGLLAGMTQVPTSDWSARRDGRTDVEAAPFAAEWRPCGAITHVFTHFRLDLTVYASRLPARPTTDEGWWSTPRDLPGEALPTLMKKAIAAALPHAFSPDRRTRGSVA